MLHLIVSQIFFIIYKIDYLNLQKMIPLLIFLLFQLSYQSAPIQFTYDFNLTINSTVSSVTFSNNGSFLYLGYNNGLVEVYDNQSGYKNIVAKLNIEVESTIIFILPLQMDNKLLLITSLGSVQTWKFNANKKTYNIQDKFFQQGFHPIIANIANNQQIIYVGGSLGIHYWNSSQIKVNRRNKFANTVHVTNIQFSNDNKSILLGVTETPFLNVFLRSIFLYDIEKKPTLKISETLKDMPIVSMGGILKQHFSINQKKILVLTSDSPSVLILDAQTLQKTGKLTHEGKVLDVIYHKNGKYIISICQNKQIYVWGADSFLLLQRYKINCIAQNFIYLKIVDKLIVNCNSILFYYNLKLLQKTEQSTNNDNKANDNYNDNDQYKVPQIFEESYTLDVVVLLIYIFCLFTSTLGFKHNSLVFYLQTLFYASFKLNSNLLYQLKFTYFQNGLNLGSYISKNIPVENNYDYGTLNIRGNIFKNASQALLIFVVLKFILLIFRGLFYQFPNVMQRFNNYKKKSYRFIQFFLKTMIYPLIFFGLMTLKNYRGKNDSDYAIYSVITSIILLIVAITFCILKIFVENISIYNKFQWGVQILFIFLVSALISFTSLKTITTIITIIILFILRQIVQIYGRYRLNKNNFQKMNYLRLVCLLLEVLSIYTLYLANQFFLNVLITLAVLMHILYILVRLNKDKIIVEKSINLENQSSSNNIDNTVNNSSIVATDTMQRQISSRQQINVDNNKQQNQNDA